MFARSGVETGRCTCRTRRLDDRSELEQVVEEGCAKRLSSVMSYNLI